MYCDYYDYLTKGELEDIRREKTPLFNKDGFIKQELAIPTFNKDNLLFGLGDQMKNSQVFSFKRV
jgi:hypothetical protein